LDSTQESASVITIEHVNEWKYGDNFLFIDITNPDRSDGDFDTGYYGELAPRLSFGKISGKGVGTGLVKDVLLTSTAEIGQGFRNYLYGVAVDLNLPGTPVFQINYYARNEVSNPAADMGSQVTLVWLKPFTIGNLSFTFEGFYDYAWGMDHVEDNIITAPRLLLDLGQFWDTPGVLQAGIEYQIWRNKYGIDDIDEDVVQAMVKWVW
jgi:nucleoside-specific outer membrane channel protein Tsx